MNKLFFQTCSTSPTSAFPSCRSVLLQLGYLALQHSSYHIRYHLIAYPLAFQLVKSRPNAYQQFNGRQQRHSTSHYLQPGSGQWGDLCTVASEIARVVVCVYMCLSVCLEHYCVAVDRPGDRCFLQRSFQNDNDMLIGGTRCDRVKSEHAIEIR